MSMGSATLARSGLRRRRSHGEHARPFLVAPDDRVLERAEVGVHDVDGHLHAVEVEALLFGVVDHVQVDGGVFMAVNPMVADLAGFPAAMAGFDASRRGEDGLGSFMR